MAECQSSDASDYLSGTGIAPKFSAEQVAPFASRVGAQAGNELCVVVAALRVNRFIYFHKTPGDCSDGASYSSTGAKALGAGTAVTSSLAGIKAIASISAAIPVIGSIIGLVTSPIMAILQHHAQAVAREEGNLCGINSAYNQAADQIEAALINGQIGLQDANAALDAVMAQLVPAADSTATYNPCNASCIYSKALKALALFNKEMIYPSLVPSNSVNTILGATVGKLVGDVSTPMGLLRAVAVAGGGIFLIKAVL